MGIRREAARVCAAALIALVVAAPTRLAGAQQQAAAPRAGVIVGVVRDSSGMPIFGAHVSVAGNPEALTDSTGTFRITGLAAGTVTVNARRLGFAPASATVVVSDVPARLELRLSVVGQMLPTVRVAARAEPYASRLRGFEERRAAKLGYFITRAQIDSREDFRMTSALRRVPGVQVYMMRGALGTSVRLAGAQCSPVVFVDGFAASLGSFDLDMIDLGSVEGIEVYPHGSSVPSDFAGQYGSENCGVIAIWMRPAPSRARKAKGGAPRSSDLAALVAADSVFLPDRVDEQAVYLAGSPTPVYPDSLYRAGVPGRVVAEFVVDTSGDVEMETVSIVSTSHSAFASAVRSALEGARFMAARRGGVPVRELITVPFDFDPKAAPRLAQPDTGLGGR